MKNNLRHSACRGTQYAACPYDPTRENVVPERPQTLRHYEIINSISDDHAQSNAERILNRSARRKRNKNCRTTVRQFLRLWFTASLRLCKAGVHGGKDGLAGHGGAGDSVHTGGGAGLCQLGCQRLGGFAA